MAQQFQLARNYSGQGFFDPWNYKVGNDAFDIQGEKGNGGNVNFTDQAFAQQQNLTSVNAAGHVVIKVDDFTSAAPNGTYGRNTVLMYSKDTISSGSLVIMDAVHIPFGCSVWPAFWTLGLGIPWPSKGEIDIIENVNLATNNQYSLHTLDGCSHPAQGQVNQTGNVVTTNCFINATGQAHNEGCLVADTDLSYGAKFAQNGGGAFATLWDEDGIRIWFLTRSLVPADMATANPNPSAWGPPTAFWPVSTCNTAQFFGQQTLILVSPHSLCPEAYAPTHIDIQETNLCGEFAGDVFSQTCSSTGRQCTDLVVDPSNYHDAYWEIKYISVFTKAGASGSSGSSGASQVSSTGGSVSQTVSGAGPGPTPGQSGASARASALGLWTVLSGVVVALLSFTWV
ncbi:concanavalin A-like lectin/glucanase domain-containing protein [Mycena capillaripes]|nr:concanavalin A-like lectin/glucanase domain-containing protein [Mycena capillaripes]